jgi:hypothetical protein
VTTDPALSPPHALTVPEAIQFADAKARINAARGLRHGGIVTAIFGVVLLNYTDSLHLFGHWIVGLIPMPRPTGLEVAEICMIAGGVAATMLGQVWFLRALAVAKRNAVVKEVLDSPGPEGLGRGL